MLCVNASVCAAHLESSGRDCLRAIVLVHCDAWSTWKGCMWHSLQVLALR
jgi:hypothetical protein